MMKRGKSLLRDRPGVVWLLGLAGLGILVAFVISTSIHSAEKMVNVNVASSLIPNDTIITANEMTSVNISASVVPAGVIQDPQAIIGKYADATIAKGEPILESDVAPASTVRQLVRTYGMNFVGATVQLDPSDLPVADVNPGDLVDLIGVYGTQNQQVYTQWIAEGVPVLSTDITNSKMVLAIPQDDALNLVRDLTVGKVRVVLDPQPFQGDITFSTKQSAKNKLPDINAAAKTVRKGKSTTNRQTGGPPTAVLPPGKNALVNAKQIKTVETSHISMKG